MEKKPIVRAAAAQIAPDLTSREKTLARVLEAIREAASKGADLIVFPETFVPWYPYFSFVLPPVLSGKEHLRLYEEAVTVPSAATAMPVMTATNSLRRMMVIATAAPMANRTTAPPLTATGSDAATMIDPGNASSILRTRGVMVT